MNCNDGYLLLIYDISLAGIFETYKYRRFRKNILRRGFEMVQYSFYKKYLRDLKSAEYEIKAVERLSPEEGNIIFIKLTSKEAEDSVIPIKKGSEIVSKRDFETLAVY